MIYRDCSQAQSTTAENVCPVAGKYPSRWRKSNSDRVCDFTDAGLDIAAMMPPYLRKVLRSGSRALPRWKRRAGPGLPIAHSTASAHGGIIESKAPRQGTPSAARLDTAGCVLEEELFLPF